MSVPGSHNPIPMLEVLPPDITPFREGNTGIPYVTTLDSGRPGPRVMVNALTHGNEICGAHALCYLFAARPRPVRGALTLSFANVAAFAGFRPDDPFASRFVDEDFNRLWSPEVLRSHRTSTELVRARELEPFVAAQDFLLDIHSMHLPSPPLLMCGMQAKGLELGRRVGTPRDVVLDWGHTAGRRMRDYGAFDDPARPHSALLVECGQHWARSSVDVAIETMLRFLQALEILPASFFEERLPAEPPPPQRVIEVSGPVTIRTPRFHFVDDYQGLEVIEEAGTVIGYDDGEPICTPYDNCVLVMPGRHLQPGLSAVRFGRLVG